MKRISRLRFIRTSSSKLSSLLLLFQRSPLVQMLFPEAKIIGGAGLGEITRWTVTTIAGLGAYDSVSGATSISQVGPTPGSLTVNAPVDSRFTFTYQVTGTTITSVSNWLVAGALPAGLTHPVPNTKTTDVITGVPTQTGTFPVTITAKALNNFDNATVSQGFTIIVGPPLIQTHPQSTTVSGGSNAILTATAASGLHYQWYKNNVTGAGRISGATGSTLNTGPLTETTTFHVSVVDLAAVPLASVNQLSAPAVVTVGTPVITSQPASQTIASGTSATLTLGVSVPSPTVLWYNGFSGETGTPNTPIAGATGLTYTTPPLTTATRYWARVTSGGITNSSTALISIGTPPADPFIEWKAAQFNPTQLADAAISGATADPDGDTFTNNTEYLFGTLPLTREPSPLTLSDTGANVSLAFNAKLATGTGYTGRTRHYALETSTSLLTGSWTSPSGYEDIAGNGQPVTYSVAKSPVPTFYRLRIWLTP